MSKQHTIQLPQPWEHVEYITHDDRDALEAKLGSRLTYADLAEDDVISETFADGTKSTTPRSRKSWLVMGKKWVKIRNRETGRELILRLQKFDGPEQYVTSISFVHSNESPELTGSDLRSFPVSAIADAYTYDEQASSASFRTFMELMSDISEDYDPLTPLPQGDSSARFSALVAYQYQELEKRNPDKNIAKIMQQHNGKSLPTTQRWITQARKRGFLPPAGFNPRDNE